MVVEGFGLAPDDYRRGRPSYPSELLGSIAALFATAQRPVADVGAGTGIMSVLLADTGLRVLAVEPMASMLERLPARACGIQAVAQALPFADGALAGIVAAQSFHWFATSAVVREFLRTICGGGFLVLVWNERDSGVDWVARYDEILRPHENGTPEFADLGWKHSLLEQPGFRELAYQEFANPTASSRAGVLARAMSTSFVAALPDQVKREVRRDLEAMTEQLPDAFDFPYTTKVWTFGRDVD